MPGISTVSFRVMGMLLRMGGRKCFGVFLSGFWRDELMLGLLYY